MSTKGAYQIKPIHRVVAGLLIITGLLATSVDVMAQSPVDSKGTSGIVAKEIPRQLDSSYTSPTERQKFHDYILALFGPDTIVGVAMIAGVNQLDNSPPEWKQGIAGYSKRFGSDFGIAAMITTTRYALEEPFKEDTLYYRCACKGVFPRLGHALVSSFTARRGEDGHRVLSIPSLVAPYAANMIAVAAWYPDRYDFRDALRMGNYSLLGYVGWNVALEFFHRGAHLSLSRRRSNKEPGASDAGSTP